MKPFTYESLPGRVVFGPGRVTEVRAEVEALDRSRVFLIADGAAKALGDAVAEQLGDRMVRRWDEVVQHVPVELADRARAAATEAGCGRGSCASAGGRRRVWPRRSRSATGCPSWPCRPRTPGSEMTPIYGLTGGRHKQTGKDLSVLPKVVVYDPELTLGLPAGGDRPQRVQRARALRRGAVRAGRQPGDLGPGARGRARHPPLAADGDGRSRTTSTPARELLYGAYLAGVVARHDGDRAPPQALPRPRRHVQPGARRHALGDPAPRRRVQRAGAARRDGPPGRGARRPGRRPGAARCGTWPWPATCRRRWPTSACACEDLPEAARPRRGRDHRQPAPVDEADCRLARAVLAGRLRGPAAGRERRTREQDVFILDAVRTPVGRLGGALAGVRPDDLAAAAVRAVVDRLPGARPGAIDEVYFGDANQAGEDNRNVARMAVLLAGLPVTIPAATVNRLCGSGLEAVIDASRAVAVGDADVVLAGGVESMSRAPWVLPKPAKGYPTRPRAAVEHDARLADDQPPHAERVDHRPRRGRRGAGRQVLDQPRGAGRVRARLAPAGRGRVGRGLVRRRGGAGRATASSTRDECIRPDTTRRSSPR